LQSLLAAGVVVVPFVVAVAVAVAVAAVVL
jgi:hypothetical protein